MTRTNKHIYQKTIRTKWPYKKHTHASVQQIYEMRGRICRKLRVLGINRGSRHLALYKACKRVAKRVTNGYNGRPIVY